MNTTIRDVARIAGVSVASVSRVINGTKPVSSEITQRVVKAINETGFKPNEVARSLVSKKSNMIGVIINDITNMFFGELVAAIERTANYYNYSTILCNSNGDRKIEIDNFYLLKNKGVDGIIFTAHKNIQLPVLDFIRNNDTPTISLNRRCKGSISIRVDNFLESYKATKYLIDLGHRNIADIRGYVDDDASGEARFEGYRKAIIDAGIVFKTSMFADGDFTIESGYNACEKLLTYNNDITAIVCASDEMAIGALNCLTDRGIKVPENVSIIGFDDIKISKFIRPRITTISQPITETGELAAKMLINIINKNGKMEENDIILKGNLIERDSTRRI